MAYNALNNLIDAYIYANGVQAITGQILNGVLKQMVSQLGSGYHLMGVAGPGTVPEQNDFAMAYFAATAGEYTDFGGITLAAGEVAVLLTSGNGSWSKRAIYNVPTTTADLENTAGFITNTVADLVNYYTKTEIDTTLADYPTLADLATALADYYTKTEIDGQMGDVDTALADRYTKTETDTKLGDYYKKTETYDKDEVDSIIAALSRQEYIVAWDGLAAPDVSAIPAGVTVTYSGTPYTGTLAASASTVNKIYMVWNGTAYDMYGTSQNGGYSWVPMGTTTVDLSQYATKTEVSQLEEKVYGIIDPGTTYDSNNYGIGLRVGVFYPIDAVTKHFRLELSNIVLSTTTLNVRLTSSLSRFSSALVRDLGTLTATNNVVIDVYRTTAELSSAKYLAVFANADDNGVSFLCKLTAFLGVSFPTIKEGEDATNMALSFIQKSFTGANLFTADGPISGHIDANTGAILADNTGNELTSMPIPVKPGYFYYLSGRDENSTNTIRCLAADGTPLKVLIPSTGSEASNWRLPNEDGSSPVVNGQFKTPLTAAYVQITYKYNGTGSADTVMLSEVGASYIPNMPTPLYTSIGAVLKEDALPQSIKQDLFTRTSIGQVKTFNITTGLLNVDGTIDSTLTTRGTSDYIPFDGDVVLYDAFQAVNSGTYAQVAIYDSAKNFISAIIGEPRSKADITLLKSNYPTAKYVRFSLESINEIPTARVMVSIAEYITTNPDSENYGKKVALFGGSFAAFADSVLVLWRKTLNLDVDNYAVSGAGFSTVASSQITTQVDAACGIDKDPYDLYILWASGNDFSRNATIGGQDDYTSADNFDPAKLANQNGGINYCVKKILEKSPTAKIVFFTSLRYMSAEAGWNPFYEGNVSKMVDYVNGQIACCERWGIPYLDQFREIAWNPYNKSVMVGPDEVHPTTTGYEFIANRQVDFISKI